MSNFLNLDFFNIKLPQGNAVPVSKRRRVPAKETPLLRYISLKLYATVRSKTLFDVLYGCGMCLGYQRTVQIVNGLTEAALRQYQAEGAVIPGI